MVGSSPRVRGTAVDDIDDRHQVRFIPAGAGNGLQVFAHANSTSVHTRGCGERRIFAVTVWATAGSSPRVRGTADESAFFLLALRFIPAGAGNGPPSLPGAGLRPVHPRGCGERRTIRLGYSITNGSSPRVRGTALFDPGVF